MHTKSGVRILLEALGLAAGLAVLFVVAIKFSADDKGGSPFRDPTAPWHSQAQWHKTYRVTPAALPGGHAWTPDRSLWTRGRLTSSTTEIAFEYPYLGNVEQPDFPHTKHDLKLGERIESNGGFIEVAALATGWPTQEDATSGVVPIRFFAPDLSTTHSKVLKRFQNFNSETERYRSYNPLPKAKIAFRYGGWKDVKFARIQMFDARTHRSLKGGHSSYSQGNRLQGFEVDLRMWHKSPVDVVLDIAHGPTDVFEFDAVEGDGYSAPDTDIRLVTIARDVSGSFGSSSDGKTTKIMLEPATDPKRSYDKYVFICQPSVSSSPFTIELLDAQGKKVGGGASTSGIHASMSVQKKDRGKVSKVRVIRRNAIERVFVHLPYWPGLPDQNQDIKNLFDITIPYANLRDRWRFEDLVRSTLQCNTSTRGSIGNIPTGYFPRDVSNMTIRQVVEDYAAARKTTFAMNGDVLTFGTPRGGFFAELARTLDRMF